MYLITFHFYNLKNYLYCKPVKGLRGYEECYGFGFNGKEKVDKLNGDGNSYDFGFRICDTRLGQWLSVDPLWQKYPSFSPYNVCLNNPIINIDPDGRFVITGTKEERKNLKSIAKAAKKEAKSWSDAQWTGALAASGYSSKKEYLKMFKNGKGPELRFSDFPNGPMVTDGNGGTTTPNGSPAAYGTFGGRSTPNITNPDGTTSGGQHVDGVITLDRGLHSLMENIKESKKAGVTKGLLVHGGSATNGNSTPFGAFIENETVLTNSFAALVLNHEMAHNGAWTHNLPEGTGTAERGNMLENSVYGAVRGHGAFGYGVFSAMEGRLFRPNNRDPRLLNRKDAFYRNLYP